MYKIQLPLFKKGSILKKEILENLRDFPRDFLNVNYNNLSDGLISGCNIDIEDFFIVVDKGIIKYKSKLYLLNEKVKIEYKDLNEEFMLKIIFLPEEIDNSFSYFHSKIELTTNLELEDNQMELCRFKLNKGAKLRRNYIDFNDFSTEFNTINIINIKYSGEQNYTLHPEIIKNFVRSISKYERDSDDFFFSILCLNSKSIEREVILQYIHKKEKIENKEYSNLEIYKILNRIYRNIKEGKKTEQTVKQRPKVILVD